ncbi:uncharacterized protein A4U43_C01F15520 [Asparagus officinalis]|uniref:Helicase ATP-binding domain-containing protein n=1 Tax=Asparagus officinalis TaxID=4686 RepID=A0A5P1FS35_ASPOF|nr:uncharacterized protein A4U43_C01F15520 [Asparagus officinalis]
MGNQREAKPKREFPAFPFDPYSIQTEFMNFLYDSLYNGDKISMLESPTGTGKTLSIICSALQWLVDRRKSPSLNGSFATGDDEEPDWMRDFVVTAPDRAKARKRRETRKKKLGFGIGDSENKNPHSNPNKTQETKSVISEEDGSEFLLDDYESEDEHGWKRKGREISDWSSSDDESEEKKRFFHYKSNTFTVITVCEGI